MGVSQICFFGSSNFWPNWVWKAKNGLGLQNWGRFENDVFPIFPGRGPICEIFGAFSARSCVAVWVRFGPLPEICLRLRCGWFFRVFRGSSFDTVFANLKRDLLKLPSLLFVFCSFLRFLLEFGSTQPCTCVLGQLALNLSFLFVFLFVCVQKHCFYPWKRVIFVNFSVSPFLSPWLHSLLLFTLVSLFLLFLFFCPSLFFCFFLWPSLFFCCSFLPCFFAFVSWQQQHQNIRCERLLFINYFCFFWVSCFVVSSILFSYLCFSLFKVCVLVNMNVFVFLRRPFSKTQILVLHFVKHYRFYWGPFCRQNWMMCKTQ